MQKTKKSGLPSSIGMRHDGHFVDLIASRVQGPRIRMIPIKQIKPNPRQARNELGNIEELMSSIKEKGILEPLLVRLKGGKYEIIAGERRYIASKRIGLTDLPCIEMNVADNEAMEISLIENLQRKDLDVFEEADGIKALVDIYDYNHQDIAEKLGKARSTVTEIISISKIPMDIRQFCKEHGISSRTTLIEIAKQKTKEKMLELLNEIQVRDLRREDTRELSKKIKGQSGHRKRFVYNYEGKSPEYYRLRIEFKKQQIAKSEIIRILEDILDNLKKNKKK